MRDLSRLFRPQTIAVFGGRPAAEAVRQCDRMGFYGDIWPVHPTLETVAGRRAFRSVAELPAAPDAAFIGVNRHLTVEIVAALAERGAGGAICYASGFREATDGAALQEALLAAAGGIPVIGPNCYGFINYLDGALLWPDQHGGVRTERGVVIVTQSSNIAINMTMQRRGLPIAYVATAGNGAQTGVAEIASGLMDDARVTAVGLHVEGIGRAADFEALARTARKKRVPIVALTVGRSEESRAATVSHTASIAGSQAGTNAFFRRFGIPRLASIAEFLEALKLLHVFGPLGGRDLCSMSCSGGEASVMADAAVGRDVRFRPLGEAEKARVQATLSDLVTVANPLDYHTFIWAQEDAMAATFSAMVGCGFDLSMLVLDFPRTDRCDPADWDHSVRAIARAARDTSRPVAVAASLPENMPEERAAEIMGAGMAPLCGIPEALAAAEAAAQIGEAWGKPAPLPLVRADRERAVTIRLLSEPEAKKRLAAAGIPVPLGEEAGTAEEAVAAAGRLGYPVAVKALGLAHKSEAGAVRLNLQTHEAVLSAAQDLAPLGEGLLVETMVAGGVAELLVGVVRDPQFGFLLTLAAGGVLTELLDDSASLLLPAGEEDIRAALLSLRSAPLLTGYRGRPAADLHAAVDSITRLARFVEAEAESLEEAEINPLILLPEGQGAMAVDALIRMRDP